MEQLLTYPKFKAFDSDGDPLSGGKVYTYITASATPKTTYSDYAKATPNANPVVLDSDGEADIILGEGAYRIVLKTSADVTEWTVDNIYGPLRPIVVTVYATESAVTAASGDIDGEIAIDAATGNSYTWDDGNSKWRVRSNNIYSSDPSDSTFTIETGTVIWQTTAATLRHWNGSAWANTIAEEFTAASIPGSILARPKFTWKDADEIYIDPFTLHHQGTTEQIVNSDAQLTFQFGSGGSNSDSDDLANNDFYYLYIDDSAVVTEGTAVISETELVAITEEPEWDAARHCWVGQTNAEDRCIGAFRVGGSADVLEFFHDGGRLIHYGDSVEESTTAVTSSWTEYTTTVITLGEFSVFCSFSTDSLFTRPSDSAATDGMKITTTTHKMIKGPLPVGASDQALDFKTSGNTASVFSLNTVGFYLPVGM